jgi:IS30 family transposase
MILEKKYSPVAILAHIQKNNLEFKTKVCFKTIYNYVHSGLLLNVTASNLPMPRKKKEKATEKKRNARNHNHTSIETRPKEIYERLEYGHWELDTVESGKGDKTCLFVFTERKTREELIFKADGKNQACLIKILDRLERNLSAPVFRDTFKTITCDNGVEFLDMDAMEKSYYNKVMKRTIIYYCHPYNACERGSNENANKLIRRWIPKGSHISTFTDKYIKDIQDWINNYPRKLFNYLSSYEYKKLCETIPTQQ